MHDRLVRIVQDASDVDALLVETQPSGNRETWLLQGGVDSDQLPAQIRHVGLGEVTQVLQVPADDLALGSTLGEGVLVLLGHGHALLLWFGNMEKRRGRF